MYHIRNEFILKGGYSKNSYSRGNKSSAWNVVGQGGEEMEFHQVEGEWTKYEDIK